MQNSQFVAERIKNRIKTLGKSVKSALSDLQLGINTISELSKGKEMSYVRFSAIAEYLDCSVDYLLGRTDNPEIATIKIAGNNSLTEEEQEVLTLMNTMNEEGIKQIVKHARYIAADNDYKKGNKSGYAQEA